MALVTAYGYIPPPPRGASNTPSIGNVALDANGEKYGCVFQAPKTGSIRKVLFRTNTVTTGDTVDVRVETVDLTTGNPSGTLFGTTTNGSQLVLLTEDNTTFTTTLTADASVTIGDYVAIAIVNGATGNMQLASYTDESLNFPYRDEFLGGAWTKNGLQAAVLGVEYSDGSYAVIEGMWPIATLTDTTFSSSSTPDEIGLVWTPPMDCRVCGFWLWADLDGDATVVLYGTDGVTELATVALDTNLRTSTGSSVGYWRFAATAELAAGSTYRLVVRPGASNITIHDFTAMSAAAMDSFAGGQAMHYTSAKNPSGTGSWTNVTTRRPFLGFQLDQFDDGAGGGGGGGVIARSLIAGDG